MVEPLGFWVVAGAVVAGVGLSVVAPASEKMVRVVRMVTLVRMRKPDYFCSRLFQPEVEIAAPEDTIITETNG